MNLNLDLTLPVQVAGRDLDGYLAALSQEQHDAIEGLSSDWRVPVALREKIDEGGQYRPFFGDTVVLPLDAPEAARCEDLRLHACAGAESMFAEPLPPATFHMTVHDLANGSDREELLPRMGSNEEACREILSSLADYLRSHPDLATVTLRPVRLYPCLNISLLLGLAPATEDDFRRLINLYQRFDAIQPLDYWLRPHVTLAYFRPAPPTADAVAILQRRLRILPPRFFYMKLDLRALSYQTFSSMANYKQVAALP